MIEKLIFLAVGYNPDQTSLGKVFSQWSNFGVFNYILPFLLIFAVIFGMLEKMKLFEVKENPSQTKKINAVIAVVTGLIAIQFDAVPLFFSVAFPKFGMAIAILLISVLLMGMIQGNRNRFLMFVILVILGGMLAVAKTLSPYFGYNWQEDISYLVIPAILIGGVVWVLLGSGKKKPKEKEAEKEVKKTEKKDEDKKNKVIDFE